jgi:TRAP-type C4-dicarboxylate transport system permease small subunit
VTRAVEAVEDWLCYLLLVALVVTTSLQVFTRYVLNAPLTWTEEVARMLFVWLIFLGSAFIVKRGSHISIDILTRVLSPVPRRRLAILTHGITLAILGVLTVKGVQLLRITGQSASPALDIPWVYVYAAFPLGMLLMSLRYGAALVRLLVSPGAAPPGAGEGAEAPL